MSFKVAVIGAGRVAFTRNLLRDLLCVREFRGMEVAFTDINEKNLALSTALCQRDIDSNGIPIKIQSTTDRRQALDNAKYVVICVRVGGLEAFETDIEIPLKYGVDQCVGDTLCAGGIMYAQRGIAAVLDFCRDIKEVSRKDCMILNYANPNAMITWACNQYGGVYTVGLCHGVIHGHVQIAKAFGLTREQVDIVCAGINHQSWYISVKHNGEDLTGKLLQALEADQGLAKTEKIRIDVLKRFGYYSTESNGHLSEYLAWYRKRPAEIESWTCPDHWMHGETGGYLRVCREGKDWAEHDFPNWIKEGPIAYNEPDHAAEHAPGIIKALETGRGYRGHFNVVNRGCITNLPHDAVVEVPGYADANGIGIPIVGDLPLGCAAICNQSISVQRIAVRAAVDGDDMLLRQAMLLDPLTGAVCTPPEVWRMTDEMLVAGEKWLPQYQDAIANAKKRILAGD